MKDTLNFSNKDLSVLFYPEDFIASLNFQFIHYLNWDGNLSIRSYFADLNDFLSHGIPNRMTVLDKNLPFFQGLESKEGKELYP